MTVCGPIACIYVISNAAWNCHAGAGFIEERDSRVTIVGGSEETGVCGGMSSGLFQFCCKYTYSITVNRGYFERFLHSTLNIFFINCSTDINPTPYLGLNMGPSSFTLKKKLAPLKFLIF